MGLVLFYSIRKDTITPAIKYLNNVIPAPHQGRDKLQPESRRLLDDGRRARVQRGSRPA